MTKGNLVVETSLAWTGSGQATKAPASEASFTYRALRPGPGRSPDEVRRHQRARLEAAMIELAVECGEFSGLTVRRLCSHAHVSTGTFYDHFKNLEGCYLETHEALLRSAADAIRDAAWVRADPEDRMRAALVVLAERIAADPLPARFAVFTVPPVGSGVLPAMRRSTRHVAVALDSCLRGDDAAGASVLTLSQLAVTSGLTHMVRKSFRFEMEAELPQSASEAAEWVWALRDGPDFPLASLRPNRMEDQATENREPVSGPSGSIPRPADERAMILAAVSKLAARAGYSSLSPAGIRRAAGVSRKSFDTHFQDVQECFLTAVDVNVRRTIGEAGRMSLEASSWAEGIRHGIELICRHVAAEPARSRAVFTEIYGAGRPGLRRRGDLITLASAAVRNSAPVEERPSVLAAEASTAAVWNLMHLFVEAGRADELPGRADDLTYLVIAPAIGQESALAVLDA